MAKRKLDEDPRTAAERQADDRALARFNAGEFLAVSKKRQAAAIRTVEAAAARREKAARLGPEVAIIRRARGMSQEQLADTLGTQKSNISRFEKGRDGGLSIERFLGILEAVTGLSSDTLAARSPRAVLINEPVFAQFSGPNDWLESA